MTHATSQYQQSLGFFGGLVDLGVTTAVVSPGSRSTPLVLAAHAVGLECVVHHDERVAAFFALGRAKVTGIPSVLIATSGTAGANYAPAVIEANHAGVPLIAVTADRPPEHRGWGAGQTVDQVGLFGTNTRWFHDVAISAPDPASYGASVALRAFASAIEHRGPVHCNWPLREPLEPPGDLVRVGPELTRTPPAVSVPATRLEDLAAATERGLLVVGPNDFVAATREELLVFAARHRWPVLADPASGLREARGTGPEVLVTTADLLLASRTLRTALPSPSAIVHVGLASTAKAYRLWLRDVAPAVVVQVGPGADWADPNHRTTEVIEGPVAGMFATSGPTRVASDWNDAWMEGEAIAARVVSAAVHGDRGELAAVAAVIAAADSVPSARLVVSSSMPIRDLDMLRRHAPGGSRVHASRGASGIDGIIATALGVAHASAEPTVALIGDVAALHDLGGLAAAARLNTDLVVVMVDNDGGGIFSFLAASDIVNAETFRRLFTTPHGRDLVAVGNALGLSAVECPVDDLERDVAERLGGGVHLVSVRTSIEAHVEVFRQIRSTVDAELGGVVW